MKIRNSSRRTIKPDLEELYPQLISIWRRLHKERGPLDKLQTREFRRVVGAILDLKSLRPGDYFNDPELLGAYLLYHFVMHYQQGLSLLGELSEPPRRVLDVCSGPAAFSLAALKHGAGEVIAIDQSQQALKIGAEVCGRIGYPLTIRRWSGPDAELPVEGKFDLIILAHSLKELIPCERSGQRKFIDRLFSKLTPDGFILLVEDSALDSNKRVLRLRDELVKEGVAVQAPCVYKGSCPALQLENSPCYAQRELEKPYLLKEIQRAAKINLSSLKMTYILFRSKDSRWPTLPPANYHRVISPPVEGFEGKRFYICGAEGKKSLSSHLQKHEKETQAFEYLRRGELISIAGPLEKFSAYAIVKDTRLKVEAACGKPIPEFKESTSEQL